jgi:hypothetical protein
MAGLEIDDPNFPSPREIAMMKSQDPSLNDDGNGGAGGWMQKILYNTGWAGTKNFKDENPPPGTSTASEGGSGTIALEQTSYQADTPSPLSEEQEDALQWYTDGGFDATNRALRQGETVSPEDKKKIDELLGLIRSSKTTGPLSVYRGRPSVNAERATELLNLKIGDEITDSGVVSTSLDPERAKFYANMDITDTQARAVVKINVPEGSNAYLVPDEFATYNSDKEVLLPPGATLRVTNVSNKDGIRYIEADLVPRTSEDRNVGESGKLGEEIAAERVFVDYRNKLDEFYKDAEEYQYLTLPLQQAVELYQVGGGGADPRYEEINRGLRNGDEAVINSNTVQSLDVATGRAVELRRDAYLWRAIRLNIDDPSTAYLNNLDAGDIIEDGAFISTTADINWAIDFSRRYNSSLILQIEAPAGTMGVVPYMYTRKLKDEYEFILPRTTKLQVISVDSTNGIVKVRIIP